MSEPLARHHCRSLPAPCCQLQRLVENLRLRGLRPPAEVTLIIQADAQDLGGLARAEQSYGGKRVRAPGFGMFAKQVAAQFADGVAVQNAVRIAAVGAVTNIFGHVPPL